MNRRDTTALRAPDRGVRVEDFDFEIEHNGERRWIRIRGAGGCEGDGALCALNSDIGTRTPEQMAEILLRSVQARAELDPVREHIPLPEGSGHSFAICELPGARVLACRPRLWPIGGRRG